MPEPRYPALYQVNTRVWLTDLSYALGRSATLDDVADAELDRLAGPGRRAAAGDGELCAQPESVFRATAVSGPRQCPVAAGGPHRQC